MLYPETVDVLGLQDKLTLCCGGAAPVPLRESAVELEALLANVIFPEAAPLACGANTTVNATLCPAAIVAGKARPVTENSAVLGVADETVTFEPVTVSVAGRPFVLPTVTLPKLRLAGLTLNCDGDVPIPDRGTVTFEIGELDVRSKLPLAFPLACGAKVTPNVKLCPADNVIGSVNPLSVNPLPVIVSCEMVTALPPEFLRVSDNKLLLPT